MRAKIKLNRNVGIKTSAKQPQTLDSNTRVMKETKATAQEIGKM